MLDINKLRNAYKVINQLSQNKNPFAEEELTLEIVQSAEVQAALRDAAEVIAVYGKIMNLVSQSTNFSVAGAKSQKEVFWVTPEDIVQLKTTEMPLSISFVVKNINESIPAIVNEQMRKLTAPGLGRWLMSMGYLQMADNGKNKVASEKGVALGIVTEQRESQYSSEGYYVNYYPQIVQQFIFDNLPAVAEFLAKEKEENNAKA